MRETLKTKINNKRSLIATILLFIFMLSMSGVAYASSYNTTVKFTNPYSGTTRSFNGNHISYSATMSSSKKNDTGKYTIALDRGSGIWAFEVGSKVLPRVGYGGAQWPNVGAGEYRLSFYKDKDGVTLSSNDIVFKNYTP